jgi:hypothetical protein
MTTFALLFAAGCVGPRARKMTPVPQPQQPQQPPAVAAHQVSRVTTAVPFPRGLAMVDRKLYVLARGRVRESGGVDGAIDDKAGSIFVIDPNVAEPLGEGDVTPAVRANAALFAAPTAPPMDLFDRTRSPATEDRRTDRPYCALRYDAATRNFYICAFSGIDKPTGGRTNFSKNLSDAVYRYDTRDNAWHVVEKHDIEAGGLYPHHDPQIQPPPHGRLNGPDNCLVVGRWLYVVAKDNSTLSRYDLAAIARDPAAGPPASEWVMDAKVILKGPSDGRGEAMLHGHSMLAARDGYLYVGYRTSSVIVRFRLAADGTLAIPIEGEPVATFDPYDPKTRTSANLTDMAFGPDGDLYVVSAQPSRVFRFRPDPRNVFNGRDGLPAWADLAKLTGNPKMKSENLLVDDAGRVFITSGDAYAYQGGAGGAVYRIDP